MKTLYYIAVLTPEPIATEIKNIKINAGDQFGSYHALRSPAHITLVPPFHWVDEDIHLIKNALQNFANQQTTFSVTYNDFNSFFEDHVVFIDIEPAPLLHDLKNNLDQYLLKALNFSKKDRYPFHPHTTIAYRYKEENQFRAAWDYFSTQKYKATFDVNSIVLLKHLGKEIGWGIDDFFSFKQD